MNLTEEQDKILYNAINKYGNTDQIDMCIEECSELIQALCKNKRKIGMGENVREEIADVYIMLKQMQLIFDSKGVKSIQEHIDFKVNRLKERIGS